MSNTKDVYPIVALPVNKLVPLKNNPFELYEGQRLSDLVESIQANGVLVPIIVRPINDGFYETLAGNNRVKASEILELETVPAIVRDDLNDVEAMFVAIETNLIQRSFSDFSYSERAATIALHYDGIKDQGRRTDLVEEVEMMLGTGAEDPPGTSVAVRQKFRTANIKPEIIYSSNKVNRFGRSYYNNILFASSIQFLKIRTSVSTSFITTNASARHTESRPLVASFISIMRSSTFSG